MTAMLRADQGARVLKIEPSGGDPTRALSGSRVWHRGKESIVLDLRAGEGSADMERLWLLVQRADVLIESAEPGAPDHRDLTYARAPAQPPLRLLHHHQLWGSGPRHATPRHATPRHATPRHARPPPHNALAAVRTGSQGISAVVPEGRSSGSTEGSPPPRPVPQTRWGSRHLSAARLPR
jgi:hypothetical protein